MTRRVIPASPRTMLCYTLVTSLVMNRVLATHSLTAALVLYLTPSILELAFALRANINGHWDLVLYSCQLNAFLDQVKCQLAPLYNKDY